MVFILVERSRHTLRECNETWLLCQTGSVGVVLLTVTEMKTQVSISLEHIGSWRTVRGFQIPLHECWGGTSLGMKALSSSNIVWKVGRQKSIFKFHLGHLPEKRGLFSWFLRFGFKICSDLSKSTQQWITKKDYFQSTVLLLWNTPSNIN